MNKTLIAIRPTKNSNLPSPELAGQVLASKKNRLGASEGFWWNMLWFAAAGLAVFLMLVRPIFLGIYQDHYFYLANSLIHGSLNIDAMPTRNPDFVTWQGHRYLPLGPFPAIALIPFLPALNAGMDLGWVSALFSALNAWLVFTALTRLGITDWRRRWGVLLFCAGTILYSVSMVGSSYYFAHVVVVTILLLAVIETLGGKRAWLIGLLLGLAAATRLTALCSAPFFIWMLWQGKDQDEQVTTRQRIERLIGLGAGLAGPVLLLLLYNYARFGNPLENGYGMAKMGTPILAQALSHGLFGLVHIPKNLFMLLLQGPLPYPAIDAPVLEFPFIQPSPWGMGLFFTTPALVYAFRARGEKRYIKASWLAIALVLIPLITYYGIGFVQFGFRYALDFLPFLALLAILGLPQQQSKLARWLIIASVIINIWGAGWLLGWTISTM